jgi:serine/threonine protein kinase
MTSVELKDGRECGQRGGLANEEGWPLTPEGYMVQREGKLVFTGPVVGAGAFATVVQTEANFIDPNPPSEKPGEKPLPPVAVKIMKLENITTTIEEMQTEVRAMKLNRHANVLSLHCCFVVGSELWLVMPFMDKGSCCYAMKKLAEKRKAEVGLGGERVVAFVLHQVLQGLAYIHENAQIHRDIKAGNILLDGAGNVCIADFGVAGWFQKPTGARERGTAPAEGAAAAGGAAGGGGGGGGGGGLAGDVEPADTRSTFVGTPCWMAPEVVEANHKKAGYNEKVDIWSLGITALELVKGYAPYQRYKPMEVLLKTIKEPPPTLRSYGGPEPKGVSKLFENFVARCLVKSAAERPSARELLEDELFKAHFGAPTAAAPFGEHFETCRRELIKLLDKKNVPSVNTREEGRSTGAKTRSGGDPSVAAGAGATNVRLLDGTSWNFGVIGAVDAQGPAVGGGLEGVPEDGVRFF